MIDKTQVEHIAELARLELSEAEVEQYSGELTAVLGYIDQLNKVATNGVEPTAQVTGLVNRTRQDVVQDWPAEEKAAALSAAKRDESGLLEVKKVFNK